MKIGVVSDTHGYFDPRLREYFAGVEGIVHAGDVDSQTILDELAEIAPVYAVRGNVDSPGLNLPLTRTVQFEGVQVESRHILPAPQSALEAWSDGASLGNIHPKRREIFLAIFDRASRVVVFGHSHEPCLVTLGHTLFFNPGSAGKKRFSLPRCCGMLEISPGGVRGALMSLDGNEASLPRKVWLPTTG